MAKFMVLYRSSASASEQMAAGTPEQAQAGMEAWMKWAGSAGSALLDLGSPLNQVATVGNGGSKETGQPIGGFSILEAPSADAAKKLVSDHPHLGMPGDSSIEILEYLPIPGS
jgi:hypothetical protein